MSPALLIRADADPTMGTGHVMRCLALAQAWADRGGRAVFATRLTMPVPLRQRIESEGFEVQPIEAAAASPQDAAASVATARSLSAHWIVVDGYAFGPPYQRTLRDAGFRVLAVDDYGQVRAHCADVILDQNLGTSERRYADCADHCALLLGPQYAMLRKEFWLLRGWERQVPQHAQRVLVTLGGSDPDNVTTLVVRAIAQLNLNGLETAVVVGAANPHRARIEAAARSCASPVRLVERVQDMTELMRWADVAVSAGGTTCWELAFLGLPNLMLVLAENQRPIAEALHQAGVGVNLGWFAACSAEQIAETLRSLIDDPQRRCAMSRAGRRLVDGRGAFRVTERLSSVATAG